MSRPCFVMQPASMPNHNYCKTRKDTKFNCLPGLLSVLWLFLTVLWIRLQCVIVVFLIMLTYLFKEKFNQRTSLEEQRWF